MTLPRHQQSPEQYHALFLHLLIELELVCLCHVIDPLAHTLIQRQRHVIVDEVFGGTNLFAYLLLEIGHFELALFMFLVYLVEWMNNVVSGLQDLKQLHYVVHLLVCGVLRAIVTFQDCIVIFAQFVVLVSLYLSN